MKIITALAIYVGLAGCAGSALASPLTIVDTVEFTTAGTIAPASDATPAVLNGYGGGSAADLSGLGDYLSWTQNFTFEYTPESILSGVLSVTLSDDEVDSWSHPFTKEYAFGWTDGGDTAWGEVNSGIHDFSIDTSSLTDGSLLVTVLGLGGDFKVLKSSLEVKYNTAPVPEPTTLLLFGSGLAGLAAISRRKIKH